MKTVVACHKDDFYLTKICVASIRYYHPQTEIFILKDLSNGDFSSSELEKAFGVKILDLGIKRFGWAAAKMHLLLSDVFLGEKIFLIDSDIVFIGPLLDRLEKESEGYDFVVSSEDFDDPYCDWFRGTYYNLHSISKIDPQFRFPGYMFNTGQMVITTGKLKSAELSDYFDPLTYPYWKFSSDIFPCVDQSLLNYFLPKKEQHNEIRIRKIPIMIWSERGRTDHITVKDIANGKGQKYLIHWAGAPRAPYLRRMSRHDILFFFQNYYYSKIPFGTIKKYAWQGKVSFRHHLKKFFSKLKAWPATLTG